MIYPILSLLVALVVAFFAFQGSSLDTGETPAAPAPAAEAEVETADDE